MLSRASITAVVSRMVGISAGAAGVRGAAPPLGARVAAAAISSAAIVPCAEWFTDALTSSRPPPVAENFSAALPQRVLPTTPPSAMSEIAEAIPSRVLIGQKGVPKYKKSLFYRARKTSGIHFRHKYMRYQPWYFCPLCAEPKQQGTCCRREDCRQIKP